MNELIKSHITTSFTLFIDEFGDVTSIDKKHLEEKAGYKINELFKKQRNCDLAKKKLGHKDFQSAVAIYFSRFLTPDGVDAHLLKRDLESNSKALKLHLKKDAMRFLNLLAQVGSACEERKGLL